MSGIRAWLALAGKSNRKISVVFGVSPDRCAAAVRYLRRGAPEIPVWLFSVNAPDRETAALCERSIALDDSLALLVEAEKQLWPHWVAIAVATWTGEHGRWPVKLAPFLIPPFRTLFMNEHGDFFPGTGTLRHLERRIRDGAHSGWNRAKDVHRGAWLWLFALIAQRSAPLSRWAFHKWHGSSHLTLQIELARLDSIDAFRYQSRHWNWEEVTRFVRASTASHLLFQTTDGDPRPLAPLFSYERTFAASRQADFQDWKPSLFATSAFRRLQPGEAAQTLAPVSDFLLVDREKLLALGGIPKTVVPGAAWLLLFWRAAAAGWRSYSVGHTGEIAPASDWPYEEAEFVTRVLSEPVLRALGPTDPALRRGNIAFAIGANRKGSRKTALVVSPYLPYPLSHGGAVRIYNLCRALSEPMDFVLACFREKTDFVDYTKLHEVFREVYVLDRDEKASRDDSMPKQVREDSSASMRALIAELCGNGKADVLQIEFTHLAHFRDAAPETPAILVEHDLTFTLYRQFADRDPSQRREYERWLAYERRWLPRFDAVWTMSEDDREQATAEGARRAHVIANGVDIARFLPQPPTDTQEVLYIGSFRHRPNVIGFEKLRCEVMPLVWRRFPNCRLRVVAGPNPELYWTGPLDSRIQLHAFVEDVRPLYAQAAVVAVPLEVSAGTNIKVMEAMACARAVVSTPIGCAGLGLVDGRDALIRATVEDFAGAICDLLASPDLRRSIAEEARRTVEQRFDWSAIAEHACASYLELQS